jgi:hypothetical protein
MKSGITLQNAKIDRTVVTLCGADQIIIVLAGPSLRPHPRVITNNSSPREFIPRVQLHQRDPASPVPDSPQPRRGRLGCTDMQDDRARYFRRVGSGENGRGKMRPHQRILGRRSWASSSGQVISLECAAFALGGWNIFLCEVKHGACFVRHALVRRIQRDR